MLDHLKGAIASVALAVAATIAGAPTPAAADVPESKDPIRIAIHEWTGQHITSYIAGEVLKKMGYNVEYVTAAMLPAAVAMADGNLSLSLEMWDNNLGEFWPGMLADGKIADLGTLGLDAREGWLYPVNTKEKCPGLPAWDAFLACSDIFATAETFPKGRFVEYPADWSDRATQLIKGEGLNFEAIPAGSEGALVAELKAAVQKDQPLVMMFWAPHWVLTQVKTEWIDIPQPILDKYSMQIPRVFKTAWPGAKDKWPTAWKFIEGFTLNNDIQGGLMDLIDNQGQDGLTATKAWVDANQAYWQPMVDKAMAN